MNGLKLFGQLLNVRAKTLKDYKHLYKSRIKSFIGLPEANSLKVVIYNNKIADKFD
jgi:hypothetical protein